MFFLLVMCWHVCLKIWKHGSLLVEKRLAVTDHHTLQYADREILAHMSHNGYPKGTRLKFYVLSTHIYIYTHIYKKYIDEQNDSTSLEFEVPIDHWGYKHTTTLTFLEVATLQTR